jgi:hypothetical protein
MLLSLDSVAVPVIGKPGDTVFLLDRAKSPSQLEVSFRNEVSWSGQRR